MAKRGKGRNRHSNRERGENRHSNRERDENRHSNSERDEKRTPEAAATALVVSEIPAPVTTALKVSEIPTAAFKVSEPPTAAFKVISKILVCLNNLDHHEEEKRVFFLILAKNENKQSFYALYEVPRQDMDDQSRDSFRRVDLPRCFEILPSSCYFGARAIALGSVIYVLGGYCPDASACLNQDALRRHFHSDVYCLDTVRPQDGWKTCAPMRRPRQCPLVSAVDGKIYVFGGTFSRRFSAEVFDPKKNKWEFLPELPYFGGKRFDVAPINAVIANGDGSNKRILLHLYDTKPLFAFFVDNSSWCCLDPHFCVDPHAFDICETSVVVDDILYCYSYSSGKFRGYDLIKKIWYPVEIRLAYDKYNDGLAYMFSLGGNTFCFVYGAQYYREPPSTVAVGCVKLKTEREKGNLRFGSLPPSMSGPPRVTEEFHRYFNVEGFLFECCVIF